MRLLPTSRRPPAAQVEAARARVSGLGNRTGWVPRVPHIARTLDPVEEEPRPPGRHARRGSGDEETGHVQPAAIDPLVAGLDWPAAERDGVGLYPRPDGHDATEPAESTPDEPHSSFDTAIPPEGPPSPASRLPGALADRLPLPLRALVEGLPPGVQHGRFALQSGQAAVVVLVIVLGLAVAALAVGLGRPKITTAEPAPAATVLATGTPLAGHGHDDGHGGPAEPASPSDESGVPGVVVVHVAGKVARPGIVELPAGSRVVDAIDAAGGADGGVDLSILNLARLLTDGEQIAVGVDPAPDPVSPAGVTSQGGAVVNLNTATADQLATLPGIGPALAARIVQWRDQNGRFTAVEELLEVSGIGPAKFEGLAGLVSL